MQITLNGKEFRLKKFPPIVGRKLMTCGKGINGLLDRSIDSWLDILAYVEVGLGQDQWIPLSTRAMFDNHVKKEFQAEILTAVLQYNCNIVKAMLSGPTLADAIWVEIYDTIEEAFA